jgi:hypothetical protein
LRSARLAAGLLLLAGAASPARAATRQYVVAIGNNEPPRDAPEGGDEDPAKLRYADDDAASMVALGRELGAETHLLTVLDADSQRRFPELAGAATNPTLAALRATVESLRPRLDRDVRAGDEPVVVFFFSGHGSAAPDRPASLAMLDGPLTREILYDEILARLPARYVHVIVDACHAEAVVRTRDVEAEVVAVDRAALESYAGHNTLRRFPNVGAVVATSAVTEAHEWDRYERGVFTFEVISGLRGAADVNGDGVVEYSELSAFLGSVNAGVADPRARLSVVARPPAANPRAPLSDLSRLRRGDGVLTGVGPAIGRFYVEDERGNRLGEMLPEPGFQFQFFVPSTVRLFVRTAEAEGAFRVGPGGQLPLGDVPLARRAVRERGAVDSSLRRGLFAVPFGPLYYRGFVDARGELPPVSITTRPPATAAAPLSEPISAGTIRRAGGVVLLGLGAAGTVAGAVFAQTLADRNTAIDGICATTDPCSPTDRQRYSALRAQATTARQRAIVAFSAGGAALLTGAILFLWPERPTIGPTMDIALGDGSCAISVASSF